MVEEFVVVGNIKALLDNGDNDDDEEFDHVRSVMKKLKQS